MKTIDLRQDVLGGMDQTPRPATGTAREIVNMEQDDGLAWSESGGFEDLHVEVPIIPLRCDTIHFFNQRGARSWILAELAVGGIGGETSTLYAINGPMVQVLDSGRYTSQAPWSKTQYLTMGRWVYLINGINAPQRWNGQRFSPVGFPTFPSRPSIAGPDDTFIEFDLAPAQEGDRFLQAKHAWEEVERLGKGEVTSDHLEVDKYNCFTTDRGVGDYPADLTLPSGALNLEDNAPWWDFSNSSKTSTNTLPDEIPLDRYPWIYGYAVTWINDRGMESPLSHVVILAGKNPPIQHPYDTSFLTYQALDKDGGWVKDSYSREGDDTGVDNNFVAWSNNGRGRAIISVQVSEAPSYVRAIRVYRTENLNPLSSDAEGGWSRLEEVTRRQKFYRIHESQSSAAFSFADGKPDKELTEEFRAADGLFPVDATLMALFRGSLFVAGMPSQPEMLRFSNPLFVEQFPKKNYFRLGATNDGGIRALHATESVLYAFKKRSLFAVVEGDRDGFALTPISHSVGSTSPNAIVDLPNGGVLFLNERGIFMVNEGKITKLSQNIEKFWKQDVVHDSLMRASAVVNKLANEVWIQVPVGTGIELEGVVYHYKTGGLSLRKGYNANCFTVMDDHRDYLLFGSYKGAGGSSIKVYTHGKETFDGAPRVDAQYDCAPLDFQSPWERADVLYFSPFVMHYGDRSLSVNYRVDRKQTFVLETPESRNATNTEEPLLKWGVTRWGEGVWQSYEMTVVQFPITALAMEWDFTLACSKMLIVSFDIGVAPGKAATQIRKLDLTISPDMR